MRRKINNILITLLFITLSCEKNESSSEYFGEMNQVIEEGKADWAAIRAISASVENSPTQVWEVTNQWEDTDTPEARKAGIAWGNNSGLNWNEKYQKWIESLPEVESVEGYKTFMIITPWGKQVPAPLLECAEVAMFLRVTFASWYHLPFFMQAVDSNGTVIYAGHFGWRTKNGKYRNTPEFRNRYKDYSYMRQEEIEEKGWPSDPVLRSRKLWGADDDHQPFIGPEARAGAYFDEIFLNKRVGYFLLLLLTNFGSINLADPANLYNLKPEAIKEGDVLLERWQKRGIGHTLIVKTAHKLSSGKIEAELVSGSMPRRQPKWEDAASSKYYFTSEETGGRGTNWEGDEYAKLGGGLKRWRVAKQDGGYWVNTFMESDVDYWISSTDYEQIAQRPEIFDELLGEPTPEDKRETLLHRIEEAREHLRTHPASCAARINRESAFKSLYELAEEYFAMTKKEVDTIYRILDDYVFAELEYGLSKTCCWNSTTSEMYEIIMDYNINLVSSAEEGQCLYPVVFKNTNSSYEPFASYAEQLGRGSQWKRWSEDEPCPQRDVENDKETQHLWTDFCEIKEEVFSNTFE